MNFVVGDRVHNMNGNVGTVVDSFPRHERTDESKDTYLSWQAIPIQWDNGTQGYCEINELDYAYDEPNVG
jgi:hypothetical protein